MLLKKLALDWCGRLTDPGLEHLSGLKCLQLLDLSRAYRVTDQGLEYLSGSDPALAPWSARCREDDRPRF
jgi:hypothetical protein